MQVEAPQPTKRRVRSDVATADMGAVFFVRLEKENARGALQFWEIKITKEGNDRYRTDVQHGQCKEGSKVRSEKPKITTEGKVKRSAEEQAVLEAASTVRVKKRKGYRQVAGDEVSDSKGTVTKTKAEDGTEVTGPRPMLVSWFKDRVKFMDPEETVDCQIKYDGSRALWDLKANTFISRGNKYHPNPLVHLKECRDDIVKALGFHPNGKLVTHLDGELWAPEIGFQTIRSILGNEKDEAILEAGLDPKLIVFVVFDCITGTDPTDPDMEEEDWNLRWEDRRDILEDLKTQGWPEDTDWFPDYEHKDEMRPIWFIHTEKIKVEDAEARLEAAVEHGDEGIVLRYGDAKYLTNGARSLRVIKHKYFLDGEFQIVSVELENKQDSRCGKLVLRLDSKRTFKARPGLKEDKTNLWGTEAGRDKLWEIRDEVVGKWVTVRYQELSDTGVPRFPNMVDFRDKGEFSVSDG